VSQKVLTLSNVNTTNSQHQFNFYETLKQPLANVVLINGSANIALTNGSLLFTYYSNNAVAGRARVLNYTPTNTTKLWNWSVSVTPPLPVGKELNFTLTHASNYSATTVGALTSSVSYSQTTGTTGGGQFLTSQTPIVITNNSSTVPCSSTLTYTNYLTNSTIRQYTAKIVGTGTVNGTVTQGVTITNNSSGCPVVASIIDSVSITNIQLVNQNQCEIINTNIQPLTFSLGRSGTQAQSNNNQQL
jgi:hypothetical protein